MSEVALLEDNLEEEEEERQSPNPKFWLEFRTVHDGLLSSPAAEPRPNSPATVFPWFSWFPPEIRLKIWEYLILPRVVAVCCFDRDQGLEDRRLELARRTTGGASVPVLLHVCRETRALGLNHYQLAFGWRISKLLSDTPVSREPQVYFNFNLDALFLTGDLEAFDNYGYNLSMVYFLHRRDTFRVRHVACAFKELGYPEQESDQVFGCLWHVIDRFPHVERLLLTVTEEDEMRVGSTGPMLSPDNVMQKLWSAWMGGTTATNSKMADKQMLLIREEGLPGFIHDHT